VEPLSSVQFAVIDQKMFEDYSVRLLDGGFYFEQSDATHTTVTLTTRYQPLLRPRFAWQPAEEYVVRLLHTHVLEGMRAKAKAGEGQPVHVASGALP
jgi:hypothetical protein